MREHIVLSSRRPIDSWCIKNITDVYFNNHTNISTHCGQNREVLILTLPVYMLKAKFWRIILMLFVRLFSLCKNH